MLTVRRRVVSHTTTGLATRPVVVSYTQIVLIKLVIVPPLPARNLNRAKRYTLDCMVNIILSQLLFKPSVLNVLGAWLQKLIGILTAKT